MAAGLTIVASPSAQTPKRETAESAALEQAFRELDVEAAIAAAATTHVDVSDLGPAPPAVSIHATSAIVVPATGTSGVSSPYPSNLVVSGFVGQIGHLAVRLNNVSHTFPLDLEVLLVGPTGVKVLLTSDAGDGTDVDEVHVTFQDGAPPVPLPVVTGTFAPTDLGAPGESLPAPAPAGPYSTSLADFIGTNPNGTWSLYVSDDATGDRGGYLRLHDHHHATPEPHHGRWDPRSRRVQL